MSDDTFKSGVLKEKSLVRHKKLQYTSLLTHSTKIPIYHRRIAASDESQLILNHSSSGFVYLFLVNWTDGDISVTLIVSMHG